MKRKKAKQNNSLLFSIAAITIVILVAILFLSKPKKITPIKIIKKPAPTKIVPRPKIAFILDDWGYSLKNEKHITDKSIIFTLAILPNLKYSNKIAQLAKNNKKEVMLHLPMQPKNMPPEQLEKFTITPSMSSKEINRIISEGLKSVPYAQGINNHMGSLATENTELMTKVFLELKKRKLYFIDSRTAENSVCPNLAKKMNVKFSQRSIFLDNENELEYIKSQVRELMRVAKIKKAAIGIGHDRPKTIQAIKEMLPEIKKQGINVVFVSEFFKK